MQANSRTWQVLHHPLWSFGGIGRHCCRHLDGSLRAGRGAQLLLLPYLPGYLCCNSLACAPPRCLHCRARQQGVSVLQKRNGRWCFKAVKNTHTTPLQPRAPYPDSRALPNNSCESWIQLIHATLTHPYTQPHTHPTHPRHPPIC